MKYTLLFTILSAVLSHTLAFAPVQQSSAVKSFNINSFERNIPTFEKPIVIQNQRYSMAQVQTMSLFGLGGPELAVILIAGAFLLGPEKLASLGKDAGKIAGELKEVPKEFQKGLQEGEEQAMEMKKSITSEVEKKEN
mmetsp:Transcript_5679/g.7258  ORF Transcript_5679/g.7258 Transcript_5679/m.7258 type:complete len:138 (-) Transcript_5679:217-630(-)